jgi:long-chain acyl-CoA synthetase
MRLDFIMIIEKLHQIVQTSPEKTAIVFKEYHINYSELNEIINKLSQGLQNSGIAKGDKVALMLPNVPHFIFSYFALQQIGAIVVPVNYMFYENDLNYVLRNSELKAIIYWDGFRKELKEFFVNCTEPVIKIVLGKQNSGDSFQLEKMISDNSANEINIKNNELDLALLQFTSGMADVPTGVPLTHEIMSQNTNAFIDCFKLTGKDVFCAFFPLFLITSQNEILNTAVSLGATIILHSKIDIPAIAKSIDEFQVSVVVASPQLYKMLVEWEDDSFSGSSLKTNISTYANLPEELAKKFNERFNSTLLNSYTITETGGIVTTTQASFENLNDSVGRALPGFELQIHNASSEPLPFGEIGEIAIRSKSMVNAYWRNDELTLKRFKNDWFYSGDFGKRNADGDIVLVEKKADIILKGGFRIHTSEIENLLATHPCIREAAVISVPSPNHKEDVLACVILNENESLTGEEVIEFCRSHIPVYKCPQVVKFYEELPRTRMGKVFKRKLKQDIENN